MIFCFFACREQVSAPQVEHVQATEIKTDLFMGLPVVMKIAPQDSVLWISDFSTDCMVSALHKRSGRTLCQTAMQGNGPSEMTPPVHLFFYHNDLCLYDRNKRKLYRVDKDSILITRSKLLHEVMTFADEGYNLVYPLTDSSYLGTGLFDKRFLITDAQGKECYRAGELPMFWGDECKLSSRVRSLYHQTSRLSQHPTLPLFVASTSDVLSAYRVEQGRLTEIFQIPLHDYAFNYQGGEFVSTQKRPEVPQGILDLACDDQYIYVLYDPNGEATTQRRNTEIRCYDWNGGWVRTIIPDVNLSVMAWDAAEHTLYGISPEHEASIWSLSL